FMLGIGIGAGQPCVLAYVTEHAEHIKDVPDDEHCRWLALATNTMVNMGYVIAAFVVLVLTWFIDENYLRAVWALSSGPGCIYAFLWCPFTPRHYPLGRVPHWQTFKRYWRCLLGLLLSWFIYDFIRYLVIYSSVIMNNITGGNSPLWIMFGWSFFIHAELIPGTVLGAFFIDHRGPKTTMIVGLLLQAAVGFGMVTVCKPLTNHIAGFAVFYGIFLSLGEVGPGNCLSVLTARTIPTAIREQFYGIAAGIGKVGALVGTWVFPQMIDAFGDSKTAKGSTGPFWSGSGLAILSAVILFFLVEPLSRDGIKAENEAVRSPHFSLLFRA
ncbi:major facilitator superfamily domain-containing protein, partial [Pisolithus marmoratus]